MSFVENPKYRDFMPVCMNCDGHCCHQGYLLLLPEDVTFFEKKIPSIVLEKIGSIAILDLANNGCPFQRGHLCGIYKDRPLNCRIYPFSIVASVDGKTFGFDYAWCERCDPGNRETLKTTEDWFKAYGINMPRHIGFACLWVIRELRSRQVIAQLTSEEREYFLKRQAEIHAEAGKSEKTIPIFDPKYLSNLFFFGQMTYQSYMLTHNKKPITTRALIAEIMKHMKGLLLHNKNQPIEY